MSAVCLKDIDSPCFICYHADMLILAHDPAGMMTAFVSVILLFVFGLPLLYSVLAGLSFMLAGIGAGVAWWRRLLAPGLCAVNSFVLVGLSMLLLFFAVGEGPTPVWVSAAYYLVALLLLLQPVVIGRKLLHFSWWRVACAGVLVPLLHVVLAIACGAGLLALLGNSEQGINEQQSTVTGAVETPPAPELPAAVEAAPL